MNILVKRGKYVLVMASFFCGVKAAEQPTAEQPMPEQPAIEQSAIEQSTIEQSTIEQSTIEQSTIEQSTIEQPVAGPHIKETMRCDLARTIVDHISFAVHDYAQSEKFYDETLKLLGIERLMTFSSEAHKIAGYGINEKPSFWIAAFSSLNRKEESIGKAQGLHVAFRAPSVEAIQEWHKKCIELGGVDNGAPGPRPEYHPGYYGGFIIDPNGWRIEAVLHDYKP